MIQYQEAISILLQRAHSFGVEKISLDRAYGRVLAEQVMAERDYPPYNRSRIDGYALRFSELGPGIHTFKVVETIFAGSSPARLAGVGECYKIMNGSIVPGPMDIVIGWEDVQAEEGTVTMSSSSSWRPFLNIARQGEDLHAGDLAIAQPCVCDPAVVGLLASLGKVMVAVQRHPKIALLTTGNEVVPAAGPVGPAQIRNSNRWALEASLAKQGIEVTVHAHLADELDILQRALAATLSYDIVIVCGGVSTGETDYIPAALKRLGVQTLFHKIAIRPGKPTYCGVLHGGGIVFAMPGSPFACLANFNLLIRPYLHACFGLPPCEPISLPLEVAHKKRTTLDDFFPVRLHGSPGCLSPIAINGSGDIRLGWGASGLALHAAESDDLQAGAGVLYFSFDG